MRIMWKLLLVFSTVVLVGCASEDADIFDPTLSEQEAWGCGPNEFPPLDTDAQSALDELVNGLPPLEAAPLELIYQWSIVIRTDEQLVLFGRGETPEAPAAFVEFVREDGEWTRGAVGHGGPTCSRP